MPAATTSSMKVDVSLPPPLIMPPDEFFDDFKHAAVSGREILAQSSIDFVGLARDCEKAITLNLWHAGRIGGDAKSWRLFVSENDSKDGTKQVIKKFASENHQASASLRNLRRKSKAGQLSGKRTEELAQYREQCRKFVESGCSDYTIVVDWDAKGSWSTDGMLTGIYHLASMGEAYGMASISLMEHPGVALNEAGQPIIQNNWIHYDAWALRLGCDWDDYSKGMGGWKHSWLPPVGSPPVPVYSAFGGLCIYKTSDYIIGEYAGDDCEHVPFHRSIRQKTGKRLFLNPSQRTVMGWQEADPNEKAAAACQP